MICLMSFYNISWDLQTKFPFYFRSQNNHFSFIHYSVRDGFFLRFQAFYFFKDHLMCFIFWIRLLRMWNAMLIFCLFFIIPISSYWFTSHTKTFWRGERAIFSFSFSFCILFIFSFSPPVSFSAENRTNFSLYTQAKILQVQDGSDFESVDKIIQSDHSLNDTGYPVEPPKVVRKAFFNVSIQIKGTEPYLPVVLFIKGPKIRRWLQ